jgi:hypothetical protein
VCVHLVDEIHFPSQRFRGQSDRAAAIQNMILLLLLSFLKCEIVYHFYISKVESSGLSLLSN